MPGLALRLLAVAAAALVAQPAPAADDLGWPNRTVRIVATSPPGGSVDLLARILAQDLTKKHGQPFVVENRPGANGDLGVASVLRAPADGHALFVAPAGPFSINLSLRLSEHHALFEPGDQRIDVPGMTLFDLPISRVG